MVGVPLPHPHSKCFDILVELIEKRDALDDQFDGPVDVELDLAPGVSVAKTQLCLSGGFGCERLDQLVEVEPEPRISETVAPSWWVEDSQDDLIQLLGKV